MNGHSDHCQCIECQTSRSQQPPQPGPVPAPEDGEFRLTSPSSVEGQLRDDDGRWATQSQAISQLNSTVKELSDRIDGLRYDHEQLRRQTEGRFDNDAVRAESARSDHDRLKLDFARQIESIQSKVDAFMVRVNDDLSQLAGEIESAKTARKSSPR